MAVGRDGHVVLLSLVLLFSLAICFRSQLPGDTNLLSGSSTSPESFASLGWHYFKPSYGSERSYCGRDNTASTVTPLLSIRKYDDSSGFIIGLLLLCGDFSTHPDPSQGRFLDPKRSTLNCLVSNARSIKGWHKTMDCFEWNLSRFQELAYAEESDIFVSETWLSSDVLNSEILPEDYFISCTERKRYTRWRRVFGYQVKFIQIG